MRYLKRNIYPGNVFWEHVNLSSESHCFWPTLFSRNRIWQRCHMRSSIQYLLLNSQLRVGGDKFQEYTSQQQCHRKSAKYAESTHPRIPNGECLLWEDTEEEALWITADMQEIRFILQSLQLLGPSHRKIHCFYSPPIQANVGAEEKEKEDTISMLTQQKKIAPIITYLINWVIMLFHGFMQDNFL